MWGKINNFVYGSYRQAILSMSVVTVVWLLWLSLMHLLSEALGIGRITDTGYVGTLSFRMAAQFVQTLLVLLLMWKLNVFNLSDFTFKGTLRGFLLAWVSVVTSIGQMAMNFMAVGSFVAPDPLHFIVSFLQPFIGTGLIEEVLFRGLVFFVLMKAAEQSKRGIMSAVIVSSIIFGLAHFPNLFTGANIIFVGIQIISATNIGLFFAVMYLRTKTLWIPIILHGLFNLAGRIHRPLVYVSSYVGDYIEYMPQEGASSVAILIGNMPFFLTGIAHLVAGLVLFKKVQFEGFTNRV